MLRPILPSLTRYRSPGLHLIRLRTYTENSTPPFSYSSSPSGKSDGTVLRKLSTRALLSQYASLAYPQQPIWSFSDLESDPQQQKSLRMYLEHSGVDDLHFLRWRNALIADDFDAAVQQLSYGLHEEGSIFVSRRYDTSVPSNVSLYEQIRKETPAWIIEWILSNKLSSASHIIPAVQILRRYPEPDSAVMLALVILFCIVHEISPPLPRLLHVLRSHAAVTSRILGVVLRALAESNKGKSSPSTAAKPSPALSRRLFAPSQPSSHLPTATKPNSYEKVETGRSSKAVLFDYRTEVRLILETMLR